MRKYKKVLKDRLHTKQSYKYSALCCSYQHMGLTRKFQPKISPTAILIPLSLKSDTILLSVTLIST